MSVHKRRTAVLISGRGSNLAAIIKAAQAPDYPAEVVLVISNEPGALGLGAAQESGIASAAIDHRGCATRSAHEERINAALLQAGAELLCLAGFMRVLSHAFVEAWRDKIINIHPSLLPAFPGLHTHARALAAGVKLHGATVHFVRSDVDQGPIIAQAALTVHPADTAETLAMRVLKLEHILYPLALRRVASGEAQVIAESVAIPAELAHCGGELLSLR